MITIFIPTPLRKFTQNQAQVEVDGNTVGEAVSSLTDKYPEIAKHLLDDDRNLRRFVRVYVGEDDIQQLKGASTALSAGDKVSIIPAIAGGTSNTPHA